ncbi:MAG: Gfo/Idh/MocA family oxidoreductase [Gemmataceae bacterium]
MSSVSRRTFLGATAAALPATVWAAPSDKVVVGVMGAGGRGTSLAKTFAGLPNVEVAYVCDPDEKRVNAAAAAVGKGGKSQPKAVGDFRRILDDKAVDALVCAAPNHWHGPATILACAAGKHVYVEKPCSHTAREAELMVEAARKHDRRVQVGTQRRSYPGIQEAVAKLHDGVIGRVYFAQGWYTNDRASIGNGKEGPPPAGLDYDLWQGPVPRRPFRTNTLHYTWHWFWHWGNGLLP